VAGAPAALGGESRDQLQRAVLAWFDEHRRDLPFRGTRDPYAVLVSEVMLQQTQVGRVAQAWPRFLKRFPTLEALAAANLADVLREWVGLGYNRRAVNLHRLARIVLTEHGGELPASVAALEQLPGVGPYTARAIAAIAFGQPVGAVDTNIRRVVGRLAAGTGAGSAAGIQALADTLVAADRPGDWTHALMDVGATICRTRRPACDACPLNPWCRWAVSPAPDVSGVAGRVPGPPFAMSSRWLRGRILDRLREAAGSAWVPLQAPIGGHDAGAVESALGALERDGLLERHPRRGGTARLPASDNPPAPRC
jgi:A/G-specific adenine glycosylase